MGRVAALLKDHHLLLVTLLLWNAVAMEALPIFLDVLVPSWAAIVLSVIFVLFFGEVVPQAVCTANPLSICSKMAVVVRGLQLLAYPFAKPVAALLDRILGEHSAHVLFKRSELTTLINMHDKSKGGDLEDDEVKIIRGVLAFSSKTVEDCLMEVPFRLSSDQVLDESTLVAIQNSGHTRIPVYANSVHNIKGVVNTTHLIACNPTAAQVIGLFIDKQTPLCVLPTLNLRKLLQHFQMSQTRFAIVTKHASDLTSALHTGHNVPAHVQVMGFVMLEDVIKVLMNEQSDGSATDRASEANGPGTPRGGGLSARSWEMEMTSRKLDLSSVLREHRQRQHSVELEPQPVNVLNSSTAPATDYYYAL